MSDSTAIQLWKQLAEAGNISLRDEQLANLERFLELLIEANQRMNLTRIVDPQSARILHIADALTLLASLPAEKHRLADVGSGGGVPGIILAIARPETKTTLIESTHKKADFLLATAHELGLENVIVLPQRAEDVARGEARGTFDVAVARAVGKLDQLIEWMFPLLKPGGVFLAMKGPRVMEELPEATKKLRRLGCGGPEIIPAPLPEASGHVIVKFMKPNMKKRR